MANDFNYSFFSIEKHSLWWENLIPKYLAILIFNIGLRQPVH